MIDYIPSSDAEMNLWQANLIAIVEPNLIVWDIPEEDFAAVKSGQIVWEAAYSDACNRQNCATAGEREKNIAGDNYKKIIRCFVAQWLNNNPKVSDSDRTRLGLSINKVSQPASPVSIAIPQCIIDFSTRKLFAVHFWDEISPCPL